MSRLFEFVPPADLLKAAAYTASNVLILSTNVAGTFVIPSKFMNQGFEQFVNFLKGHPLNFAISGMPDVFKPSLVAEFWCTCNFISDSDCIQGTISNGRFPISLSVDTFRRGLRPPFSAPFSDLPSEEDAKTIVHLLGYDPGLAGKRDAEKTVLRQCFPAGWRFLTGVIGRCLGYKQSSLDQLNAYELCLLYGMVLNKNFDYARLIFDQLISLVTCKTRTSYVAFPRFLALALQFETPEYGSAVDSSCMPPSLSPKIFGTSAPADNDPSLLACMTGWISSPYQGLCLSRVSHPVLSTVALANPEDSSASGSQPPITHISTTATLTHQSTQNPDSSSEDASTQSESSSSSLSSSDDAPTQSDSSSSDSDAEDNPLVVSDTVCPSHSYLPVRMIPSRVRGTGHIRFESPEPEIAQESDPAPSPAQDPLPTHIYFSSPGPEPSAGQAPSSDPAPSSGPTPTTNTSQLDAIQVSLQTLIEMSQSQSSRLQQLETNVAYLKELFYWSLVDNMSDDATTSDLPPSPPPGPDGSAHLFMPPSSTAPSTSTAPSVGLGV
ncbi:hypothetical protein L1887_01932 [Cichorium endivia]|nr:hypothetical protein L1887_01932 [Cichorium endivia]